jgi:hypothetical protein
MSNHIPDHPSDSGEQRHPLDGVRLRLPVPKGHHHTEVVASLARMLSRRYDLEPFDLQLFDAPASQGGILSMQPYTPERKLDLFVKRSRAAVRCASSTVALSAMLQESTRSTRIQARLLTSEGQRQREASVRQREMSRLLRETAASLR